MPEFADSEALRASEASGETASKSVAEVGFAIEAGRSPLLDEPLESIDPVDYEVSGVALLSGVNSGGKTSTLDLVASVVVVLAHMGLAGSRRARAPPAVRRSTLPRQDPGTLDAGAFESTVREFADLAQGGEGSLVLVDELESITEPGASAKIIAGILEALSANGATAVFVSHLAGEIREMADYDVTVDGIEAVGLVDGALEVNRSPVKDHLARSTPELIVEKLAGEARTTRSRLTAARPQTARATRNPCSTIDSSRSSSSLRPCFPVAGLAETDTSRRLHWGMQVYYLPLLADCAILCHTSSSVPGMGVVSNCAVMPITRPHDSREPTPASHIATEFPGGSRSLARANRGLTPLEPRIRQTSK